METTNINPNPAPIISPTIQSEIPVQNNSGMSQDTKTIIVVLLLVLAYPIGIILMFVWMKWPWWVKLLVALPTTLIFLAILGIMAVGMLATINPKTQLDKAAEATMRNNAAEMLYAIERYYAKNSAYPWGNNIGYKTTDVGGESWVAKLVAGGEIKADFVGRISGTTKLSLNQGVDGVDVCYKSTAQSKVVCVP